MPTAGLLHNKIQRTLQCAFPFLGSGKGTQEEEEISTEVFHRDISVFIRVLQNLPYLPSDCCGNTFSKCAWEKSWISSTV